MRLVLLTLGVFAFAATFAAAFADASPARAESATVSASVEPRAATVGDRLTLRIVVRHDAGALISGPGFGDAFGSFELIDVAAPRTRDDAGREETVLEYTIAAFSTGALEIPALDLTSALANDIQPLQSEPISVQIESVLAPGETELRPLKPQLELTDGAPSPLVPAAYVAVFALLTAFGYVLVRRTMEVRPAGPAPVHAPAGPHVAARARLDALATPADDAALVEWYAGVSATVRAYLGERYRFPAYAMTRRELERDMRRAGIERWPARLTANLLEQCDAVEFAGFRPAPERVRADLTAAHEIITLTTPEPPPQPVLPRSAGAR